jgi:hypothetical protein
MSKVNVNSDSIDNAMNLNENIQRNLFKNINSGGIFQKVLNKVNDKKLYIGIAAIILLVGVGLYYFKFKKKEIKQTTGVTNNISSLSSKVKNMLSPSKKPTTAYDNNMEQQALIHEQKQARKHAQKQAQLLNTNNYDISSSSESYNDKECNFDSTNIHETDNVSQHNLTKNELYEINKKIATMNNQLNTI